jgi:uncharacterized OB-fold protein
VRFFVPEDACPACLSTAWEWVPSAGVGTVYASTTVHRPTHPVLPPPYVVAVIDLDDGWTMFGNVVGCAPDDVVPGMRVVVSFIDGKDHGRQPCFEPLGVEVQRA